MTMHIDSAGRGIYYALDRVAGHADWRRLVHVSFDIVIQSSNTIAQMRQFGLIA